ncbi:XylR N-terminal domain-containing protein [Bradyrhizobium sp. CCGUVB1N3]|uniref:XylR N-terminal domain-containing protein n=1 Tax=Bradyrhizobium sp. CCGUVB1N3 TaxID=2949629 RepID=UPI0020B45144|nr:XylR N-terminal domain-containing protein [Bradyrhizobium sp. CCGUVB1N3]MCP3473125.1 XylR N-terminal domain-containing protein [Bradyrhizobium sp. CCGUVB1N3]
MQINAGQEPLLDRGGRPTLRELLRDLVFSPGSGSIRLNKERLVLQRASQMSRLRNQLVERYGRDEAFVMMTRLGFVAGREDADFVRRSWPGLDPGDAFTAGTRLHMLCGCVNLKTIHNDFDIRRGRFSGEFLWRSSAEAMDYSRDHGNSAEPVCWSQVGYASGYATHCLGKLIVYKELECLGMGQGHCRVMGKPAEVWGESDELVRLYRNEILKAEPATPGLKRTVSRQSDDDPVSSLMLAPIRERIEKVARFDVPVLILGEPGTGKRTAARAWSEARFGADGVLDIAAADTLDGDSLDALFDRSVLPTRGRRPRRSQRRVVLTDIELLAPALQRRLARRLDEGDSRVAATTRRSLTELRETAHFDDGLLHRLAVAPLVMPPLRTRHRDIPMLAKALLQRAARRHGANEPILTSEAVALLTALELRGNVTELETIVTAALITVASGDGTFRIERPCVEVILDELQRKAQSSGRSGLEQDCAEDPITLESLNQRMYDEAMGRCNGNVAAAARLLGLSRAQLAYRLRLRRTPSAYPK